MADWLDLEEEAWIIGQHDHIIVRREERSTTATKCAVPAAG
jgi:hypothetical protein